ncbi:MAG: hydrolase [Candidatus Brockarchaeota archaeon]|nr:hydrolase [Candidatus Brockarchaeota archaeon]
MSARLIGREGAALVVIDVQEKLLPKIAGNEKVVANIVKLIRFSKICGIPIILTEQYPKGLGQTVKAIRDEIPDVDPIVKTTFSCIGAHGFNDSLEKMKISTLILTGIEAHVCVAQTALEALDRYKVCVVSDAVSSRDLENAKVGLRRMKSCGAIISSTEMVMYEILRDANTKEFKESLNLLK